MMELSFGLNRLISVIKVNIDAAIFEEKGRYGFGMVARDCTGQFVSSLPVVSRPSGYVATVEAIGVKEALNWIQDKQWYHVEVETDSKLTVQAVHSSTIMKSVFGLLVQDCRCLLHSMTNVTLCFVKQFAN
uniref:RNase H type-1 domain-containing protein n=1 Tax=Cannabis sativa TaxID=3483 RepID=A0A803Q393_CANSA